MTLKMMATAACVIVAAASLGACGKVGQLERLLDAASPDLSTRIRRTVLAPRHAGGRGLRLRFSDRDPRNRGAGDTLTRARG